MEYVRASHLLSQKFKAYLADVLPLLSETAKTGLQTLILFIRLVFVLSRPVFSSFIQLYLIISPTILTVLQKTWKLFCQQPPRALAIEAGIILVLFILTLLENRFRFLYRTRRFFVRTSLTCKYKYRQFIKQISTKSRLAALAIPHVIFFVFAFTTNTFFGSFIKPFTSGSGMVIVACIRPAILTLLLLYSVDIDEEVPISPNTISPKINIKSELFPDEHSNPDTDKILNNTSTLNSSSTPPTRRSLRLRNKTAKNKENLNSTGEMRKRAARVAREIEDEAKSNEDMNRVSSTPSNAVRRASFQQSDSNMYQTPVSALRRRRRDLFADQFDSMSKDCFETRILRFWVVFAVLWTARSLAWYFCPGILLDLLKQLDTFLFYLFIWAQIGLTAGSDVLYAIIVQVIRRRLSIGERLSREHEQKLNILSRMLVAVGILSMERASNLTSTIAESGLPLIGLLFLITPRMVTFVGTLLIGLLLPCYLSICDLEASNGQSLTRHNWLSYWAVYSLVDSSFAAAANVLAWVPLWYHAKMCFILWLQLPYYRGSVVVLDRLMGQVGNVLTSVRKEVVTPHKRKIA